MPVAEALRACWPMPRRCRRRPCRSTTRSAACSPTTWRRCAPSRRPSVSAMDGYAVRAADVATAPATLNVDRRGRRRPSLRGHGRAGPSRAHLHRRRDPGRRRHRGDPGSHQPRRRRRHRAEAGRSRPQHPPRRASISPKATCCCARASRLTGRDLMLAAAMNHPTVPVHRRPKVAVLGTGDELVPPGATPGPGEIVFSNGFALDALARSEGAEVARPRHRPRQGRGHRRQRCARRATGAPTCW